MYNYQLVNKHYVVDIDGKRFLLDTGRPVSFLFGSQQGKLRINNKDFDLSSTPFDILGKQSQIEQMVGTHLDGFICNDIIVNTSLTIFKSGVLDFNPQYIVGRNCVFNMPNEYSIIIRDDDQNKCLIDMGAMVGYGKKELFLGKRPYAHISDFNPGLGTLDSDAYHLNIAIQNKSSTLTVCDNELVMFGLKMAKIDADIVINVTDLFDEVCVINGDTRQITFR